MYIKPGPKPITVEATIIAKLPTRLVALDSKGYIYVWIPKSLKSIGFSVKEGDQVFVHADEVTKEVFYMAPKNDQQPEGTALEGEHEQ